jgi:hypothetical protein
MKCPNCGYEEERELTDIEQAVLAEREAILKYLINERVLFEEGRGCAGHKRARASWLTTYAKRQRWR